MSVIAIFGPTGSGKTDIAVRVAARLGTRVVNCDPAQCYRGFPTLTNQPSREHDAIAAHELIDVWTLSFEASFPAFCELAHKKIDALIEQNGAVVLCSGSGLYLHAALTDRAADESVENAAKHDPAVRAELERIYDKTVDGPRLLHAELAQLDPAVADRVHINDRIRIVRALEVARSGSSISPEGKSHWDAPLRRPSKIFGLQIERNVIRERIAKRTAAMFDAGLLDEVRRVIGNRAENLESVCSPTAQKLHGLSDCVQVLTGEVEARAAVEKMTTRTQQYAKRQDTWARRWPGLIPIDATNADFDAIAQKITDHA